MIEKNRPSNRHFGFLFAMVFILLAVFAWYNGEDLYRIYAWLIIGIFIGFISIVSPNLLTPFNKAWMRLGDLMGKVVSPFVLGIIFFVLLTPIGLLGRLFGRDELRLKATKASSYWISRESPGPTGNSFNNQF